MSKLTAFGLAVCLLFVGFCVGYEVRSHVNTVAPICSAWILTGDSNATALCASSHGFICVWTNATLVYKNCSPSLVQTSSLN
jgi:hypothetical protein